MTKKILTIIITLAAVCSGANAQQKQGHVMRPKPRGVGKTSVIGQAQLEVEYALNATDTRNPDTYLDLHILRTGKQLSKHYSRFLERNFCFAPYRIVSPSSTLTMKMSSG